MPNDLFNSLPPESLSPETVAMLAFVAIATASGLLLGAVWQLIRRREPPAIPLVALREVPDAERAGDSLAARFDGSLERLAGDAGLDGQVAAWIMLCAGTLAGGAVFVTWEEPLAAIVAAIAASGLTALILVAVRRRREQRLAAALPGLADMLSRAVRAGDSLEQALRAAAVRSPQPLSGELQRCVRQIDMGLPVHGAMQGLSARNRGEDLRLLTGALELYRQTGGQLAVVLERMAMTLRSCERYRGQIRATTTAGRFAATSLALAAPLLLAYLFFDRDYSHSLFDTEAGQQCLIAAAVLEAVGLVWLFALLRPEV